MLRFILLIGKLKVISCKWIFRAALKFSFFLDKVEMNGVKYFEKSQKEGGLAKKFFSRPNQCVFRLKCFIFSYCSLLGTCLWMISEMLRFNSGTMPFEFIFLLLLWTLKTPLEEGYCKVTAELLIRNKSTRVLIQSLYNTTYWMSE